MQTIADLQREAYALEIEKGWQDNDRPFSEVIALIHSEASEALEEWRQPNARNYYLDDRGKPQGIGVEMADIVIRCAGACEHLGIDLTNMINLKHLYNKTRPRRHGGKRA